ncbi:hypothetical protein RRG08_040470 [Elysia crispata]|uniref:Uncharacterized protein n=1 Tax=Elysia crispata TaxID=231223 RepID=A0AAE1DDW2_9GAST|nr:hypothetical protein RRG08_040470 [Elysia crispata]
MSRAEIKHVLQMADRRTDSHDSNFAGLFQTIQASFDYKQSDGKPLTHHSYFFLGIFHFKEGRLLTPIIESAPASETRLAERVALYYSPS